MKFLKHKRYSVLILSLVILLLSACDIGSTPTDKKGPTPIATSIPATNTEASPTSPNTPTTSPIDSTKPTELPDLSSNSSTSARIKERGKLRAGVKYDFKPFGFKTDSGEIIGFDVDIMREFAKRWLGDENAVELIQVTSADRIPKLAKGEVDIVAASMTHKRDRSETIDFSQTYFLDGQSLLVKEGSDIIGVASLNGKTVAAIEGSTSIDQIKEEASRQGVSIEILPFDTYPQAIVALQTGGVDALTTDRVALLQFAQDNPDLEVVEEKPFTKEPYGIGVPASDSDFREWVDITLQEMKKDGTYDRLYKKWFGENAEPYNIEILPGDAPYDNFADLPVQAPHPEKTQIETILERGKIIAGVKYDFKPFGYLTDNGDVAGFDVDIIREFAKRWLGDENAIEWVHVTSSDRIPKLANGEVDLLAASMTHKRDRDETIDFSQTYFLDGQSLLVQQNSGINGVIDLNGKTVAAIEGSTSIEQIQQEATKLGITITVLPFAAYPQAIEALKANTVQALTTDSVALLQFAQDNPGLVVVGQPFTSEPYGIGVPQNDPLFRELVNYTLQEMKRDGTYDALYTKWFGDNNPYQVEILPGDADYILVPYEGQVQITINESTIARIKKRGKLIAGVKYDFKPFGFIEGDKVIGFDVDLIQAMADEWDIPVEFVQVTSSDRIPKLANGEVDIVAASMTHKKDRDETIDFSQTYFLDGQRLLVRKDSGIEDIKGLQGKTVAAIEGSTSIDQIQAHADTNGVQISILPFTEYPQALEALETGSVDALTTDSVALSQFVLANDDLVIVGETFTKEPYGMGLPPGDSFFNNLVNATLQKLKQDNEQNQPSTYDRLYYKWFGIESIPYPIEIWPGEWPYTFADSPIDLNKPVQSKVDKILNEKTFVAGVKYDFKPFGFTDGDGNLVGFDVDIIKEFSKRWLGDANAVQLVQVTSADRIPKLAAGEVDIVAASMTHKWDREKTIDFSQTYFLDGQSLLVQKNSGIESIEDMDGLTVAAIEGSTSIGQIKDEARKKNVTINILPFTEYPQALEALIAGSIEALTTDSVALLQFAKDNPTLEVVGGRFTEEPYGLGLPIYDDRFQDLVNFTLQEMKADGTYDNLYRKWFGDDEPYEVNIWPGDTYLTDVNMVPMIRIPAGPFIMGSNKDFPPDEKPIREITLTEFYIDQYEVTNKQYNECVKSPTACKIPRLSRSVNFGDYYDNEIYGSYPVVWVDWEDAKKYCEFVGKRLPTEAEWEKAARGTEGFTYPWGEAQPDATLVRFDTAEDVAPIASYSISVSPYGVYNMAGNVREWVADWYQQDYYDVMPKDNPPGPTTGTSKVLRGGGWNDTQSLDITTTRRKNFLPESADASLGFRCASSTFPPK